MRWLYWVLSMSRSRSVKGWKWLIPNLRQSVKVSGPPWQLVRRLIPGSWSAELRAGPRTPSEEERSVSESLIFHPGVTQVRALGEEMRGGDIWVDALENLDTPAVPGRSVLQNWPHSPSDAWTPCLKMAQKASPGKLTYVCFRTSSPGHQTRSWDQTTPETIAQPPGMCWASRSGDEPWRSFWVQTTYSGRCQKRGCGTASRSNRQWITEFIDVGIVASDTGFNT